MTEPKVFTPITLADRWGCSKASIYRMMARGDLVRIKFPLIRFDLAQIKRIESGQQQMNEAVVYFIRSAGLIKIGKTQDITYRLRSLATSSAVPLLLIGTMPGGRELEKQLHKRFAHLIRHGEWFYDEGELEEFIRQTFKNGKMIGEGEHNGI